MAQREDILLVMAPPWQPRMAPLGLAYIAEYLRSRGVSPKVIDFNLRLYQAAGPTRRIFWEIHNINFMHPTEIAVQMFALFRPEIDAFVDEILATDIKVIGFSVNIASIILVAKIASLIKARDKGRVIILGGTGCFWENDRRLVFPEDFPAIDAFVVGEGEELTAQILERIEQGRSLDGMEGVLTRKEDFLKPCAPYYTKDLDQLPFPRFSDFDLCAYTDRLIPMLISRGCIGRCSFCIDHLMCGRYRSRSADRVMEEFKYHIGVHQIKRFSFNDLTCNGNLIELEKLCDRMLQEKINITWASYAMIRKEMTLGLLQKMKKSGCRWVCYGMESASDPVLKRMNKYYTAADAERVVRMTHEAGIPVALNIIVGFPGETEEHFNQTLSFVRRNKEYISEVTNVSAFVIMPPAKIGKQMSDYGITLPLVCHDLNQFKDENGVDFQERILRVRKTIFLLSILGVKNVIINQSGMRNVGAHQSIAIVHMPPGRVDMPPLESARIVSYMKMIKRPYCVYDFNIKVYAAVKHSKESQALWEPLRWGQWSRPADFFAQHEALSDQVFVCAEALVHLKSDYFYFQVTKDNYMVSLVIAAVLKKWLPAVTVIFGNSTVPDAQKRDVGGASVVDRQVDPLSRESLEATFAPVKEAISHKGAPAVSEKKSIFGALFGRSQDDGLEPDFADFDLHEYEEVIVPIIVERE